MAIQFPCPACRQPIEVDDELAGSQVTCPYCDKVVAAPVESALCPPGEARPAGEPPRPPALTEPTPVAGELAANPWGRWSLICGVGAIIVMLVLMCAGIMRLRPVMEEMKKSESSPESVQREMERIVKTEMENSPAILVGSVVLLALALVGTGLSIVGLTRPNARKGQATAGLIICGSFLLCQCLGMLMQGMPAVGG
ncbi:MAG TPA: hypothetical protein VMZ31_10270 [Phycisphaerae bacterium]|nr:hypothetical protein [Phycisphaerae bacterium]